MGSEYDKFWSQPGMLGDVARFGIGAYGALGGNREANAKVDSAQGPLYQQATGTAQGMLNRANVDPSIAAKQRYDQERGLMADDDASNEAQFMRNLQKRGQLGVTTYDVNGNAMDPKVYAYQKALAMRNAQMASNSLDKGEAAITANVNRANAAQGIAGNTQANGMLAANARPSNTNRNLQLLKGGSDLLKNSGMLNSGMDWLRNQFGSGPDLSSYYSGGGGLDSVLDQYSNRFDTTDYWA